jgi:hypothetical protein
MKLLTLLTFFTSMGMALSQEPIINDYVVATPDRSKVWIINNPTGQLIYDNWQQNPEYNGIKPVVALVEDLEPYRRRVKKMTKNSKKSK